MCCYLGRVLFLTSLIAISLAVSHNIEQFNDSHEHLDGSYDDKNYEQFSLDKTFKKLLAEESEFIHKISKVATKDIVEKDTKNITMDDPEDKVLEDMYTALINLMKNSKYLIKIAKTNDKNLFTLISIQIKYLNKAHDAFRKYVAQLYENSFQENDSCEHLLKSFYTCQDSKSKNVLSVTETKMRVNAILRLVITVMNIIYERKQDINFINKDYTKPLLQLLRKISNLVRRGSPIYDIIESVTKEIKQEIVPRIDKQESTMSDYEIKPIVDRYSEESKLYETFLFYAPDYFSDLLDGSININMTREVLKNAKAYLKLDISDDIKSLFVEMMTFHYETMIKLLKQVRPNNTDLQEYLKSVIDQVKTDYTTIMESKIKNPSLITGYVAKLGDKPWITLVSIIDGMVETMNKAKKYSADYYIIEKILSVYSDYLFETAGTLRKTDLKKILYNLEKTFKSKDHKIKFRKFIAPLLEELEKKKSLLRQGKNDVESYSIPKIIESLEHVLNDEAKKGNSKNDLDTLSILSIKIHSSLSDDNSKDKVNKYLNKLREQFLNFYKENLNQSYKQKQIVKILTIKFFIVLDCWYKGEPSTSKQPNTKKETVITKEIATINDFLVSHLQAEPNKKQDSRELIKMIEIFTKKFTEKSHKNHSKNVLVKKYLDELRIFINEERKKKKIDSQLVTKILKDLDNILSTILLEKPFDSNLQETSFSFINNVSLLIIGILKDEMKNEIKGSFEYDTSKILISEINKLFDVYVKLNKSNRIKENTVKEFLNKLQDTLEKKYKELSVNTVEFHIVFQKTLRIFIKLEKIFEFYKVKAPKRVITYLRPKKEKNKQTNIHVSKTFNLTHSLENILNKLSIKKSEKKSLNEYIKPMIVKLMSVAYDSETGDKYNIISFFNYHLYDLVTMKLKKIEPSTLLKIIEPIQYYLVYMIKTNRKQSKAHESALELHNFINEYVEEYFENKYGGQNKDYEKYEKFINTITSSNMTKNNTVEKFDIYKTLLIMSEDVLSIFNKNNAGWLADKFFSEFIEPMRIIVYQHKKMQNNASNSIRLINKLDNEFHDRIKKIKQSTISTAVIEKASQNMKSFVIKHANSSDEANKIVDIIKNATVHFYDSNNIMRLTENLWLYFIEPIQNGMEWLKSHILEKKMYNASSVEYQLTLKLIDVVNKNHRHFFSMHHAYEISNDLIVDYAEPIKKYVQSSLEKYPKKSYAHQILKNVLKYASYHIKKYKEKYSLNKMRKYLEHKLLTKVTANYDEVIGSKETITESNFAVNMVTKIVEEFKKFTHKYNIKNTYKPIIQRYVHIVEKSLKNYKANVKFAMRRLYDDDDLVGDYTNEQFDEKTDDFDHIQGGYVNDLEPENDEINDSDASIDNDVVSDDVDDIAENNLDDDIIPGKNYRSNNDDIPDNDAEFDNEVEIDGVVELNNDDV